MKLNRLLINNNYFFIADSKLGKSILITFGVIIIAVICWLSAGYIIKNPDEILYQTTDSLYVKQYKIYNTDSVVCAFKKPQQYVGIISDKYTYRYINGVPGKPNLGLKISYHTTIIYDNKIYKTNSSEIYHEYNEGDKVIIEAVFYPKYNIKILRKYEPRLKLKPIEQKVNVNDDVLSSDIQNYDYKWKEL